MAERRNWTENEVRLALALYCVTDFGQIHARNPDIIKLSLQIGRTASAVALKLANLAALDDSIIQKGMGNVSKTDKLIWKEFLTNPQNLINTFEGWLRPIADNSKNSDSQESGQTYQPGLAEIQSKYYSGVNTQVDAKTKRRIGQEFFRRTILTSYNNCCALTGIEDSRLLNASHIVPWKDDEINRVNPTNGICLNVLHDRAFDRHLITFDDEYHLIIAPDVKGHALEKLTNNSADHLRLPSRFLPDQSFLSSHREKFYQRIS